MPTIIDQQEAYFSVPQNFTHKLKLDLLRERGFDYRDVGLWYAVMHDLAKQSRRFGVFKTTVRRFVRQCGGNPVPDADSENAKLWRAFAKAKVVQIEGDPGAYDDDGLPSVFTVSVLDMHDVNTPKKEPVTGKERTAKWRAGKRDDGKGDEPASARECDESVTTRDEAVTRDAERHTQTYKKNAHPPRVQAREGETGTTPTDTAAKLAKARRRLGSLVALGDELASLADARNGSPMPPTKALAKLWDPLARMMSEFDRDDMRYGLEQAIQNNAPSPDYVHSCAVSHERKRNDANSTPKRRRPDAGSQPVVPGKYAHLG